MEITNPAQIHEVIESIVLLTEQRDQRSLEHSLYHALEDVLDGVECQALEFNGDGDFSVLYSTHEGHDLPESVLGAAEALPPSTDMQRMVIGEVNFVLVNLSLNEDQAAARVLVLWRALWDDTDTRLALGMAHVYKNFTRLLFDSEKDTLTGLFNRKRLERRLAEITAAHLRKRREDDRKDRGEFLAMLDLDHFKRINDRHGHLIGDEVLILFANILQRSLRDTDLCFRYGGEEFIVLLQDVSHGHVKHALERIRRNVERHDFPQVGAVTVSIGFAAVDCRQRPADRFIAEADRALYYAKANGRNQVCDYQALRDAGILPEPHQGGSMELFD